MFTSQMSPLVRAAYVAAFQAPAVPLVRHMHVNNYIGLDVEVCKGQGTKLWDKGGKEYLDFIGGWSSVTCGHCHQKLVNAAQDQMCLLHMTSRCIDHALLHEFSCALCQTFNYDKVLVTSTDGEANETAFKLARLWGYQVKKICPKEAQILVPQGSAWGNSITAASCSSVLATFRGLQPLMKGIRILPFNDVCSLEEALKNPCACALLLDPVLADYDMSTPVEGYLTEVRRLCTQNKVLWISNETITGLGRTGAMIYADHECVRPDILVLGRGLGGGLYPIAATLGSAEIMDLLPQGVNAAAYDGNPLACKIGLSVLRIMKEECLVENAAAMGCLLRDGLLCCLDKDDMPVLRGRGLLIAIKIDPRIATNYEVTDELKDCGLLACPLREEYIRFTPPLVVCEDEISQAVSLVKKVVEHLKKS